jgi:hypothetical protein
MEGQIKLSRKTHNESILPFYIDNLALIFVNNLLPFSVCRLFPLRTYARNRPICGRLFLLFPKLSANLFYFIEIMQIFRTTYSFFFTEQNIS